MLLKKINIGMISLGCDKNRVDAEVMLGILRDRGYNIVNDESSADVIVVNTCGFIESAKQESIDAILEMAKNKEFGRCKALIASGCLAERYSNELLKEIPELDAVVGVGNYVAIDSVVDEVINSNKKINSTGNIDYDVDWSRERVLTTPKYFAYIKIAEGCNNDCSYCIIPKIRGLYRSRSIESIIREAQNLSNSGVKELILVAQDTSKYGIDLYGKKMLSKLIRKISDIDGIEWIRLMYCYPEDIDEDLISEIRQNEKVCKYIDIPIQHVNDEILRNMRRISIKKSIEGLISRLRRDIPGIAIRTSLIVGFPGETEEQFLELYDFLKDNKLDRVGVFAYSQEEDTDAASFGNQIDEKIKADRQKRLMSLQKAISLNTNRQEIGKTYKVLVEGYNNEEIIGRTYKDAPEIDGNVYIKNNGMTVREGEFIDVKITGALQYDLKGEILS